MDTVGRRVYADAMTTTSAGAHLDPRIAKRLLGLSDRRDRLEAERAELDTDTIAAVVEARDAGASLGEVAELLGMSRAGVAKAEARGRELAGAGS